MMMKSMNKRHEYLKKELLGHKSVSPPQLSLRERLYHHYRLPMVVSIVAVFMLLVLGLFLKFPLAGQAIQQDAPVIGTLNLDGNEEYLINIAILENKMFNLDVKYAETEAVNHLKLLTDRLNDGTLKYALVLSSNPAQSVDDVSEPLAFGILSDQFSSGPLFMNTDTKADLEIQYQGNYLRVKNLAYIHPNTASFRLFNETAGVRQYQNEVTFVNITKTYRFYVNVSSTTRPIVTVARADSGVTASTITYAPTDTFHQIQIDVTPTQAKPYLLELSADVGGKKTNMTYVFAGNGVVYNYNEPGFPTVKMLINGQSNNDNLQLVLGFTASSAQQPFSLPCDITVPGSSFTRGSLCTRVPTANPSDTQLLCYDSEAGVSNLRTLEDGKGYVFKLTDARNSLEVVLDRCSLADRRLPQLSFGWNFIGIPGYQQIGDHMLYPQLPTGGSLVKLKELQADGNTVDVTTLKPGKAYWVGVE